MNSKNYFIHNGRVPQEFWNWAPFHREAWWNGFIYKLSSLKEAGVSSGPRLHVDLGKIDRRKKRIKIYSQLR